MHQWNEAIEAIEEDLTQPVDVMGLARTALTSEYHFRRMFASLAGLPISEYIRRRRLTAATAEIVAGDSVLNVAVRYGYGSGEAFNRAFKALHGLTPSQARRPGAVLHSQPRLRIHIRIEGSHEMKHRIEELGEFRLVGFTTRVPLIHEGPNPHIIEFQRNLVPEQMVRLRQLADPGLPGMVSASINIEESRAEGSQLDYWQAVATSLEAPQGFETLEVRAGTWVVFEAEGKFPDVLQHLWADAATEWFPANPYRWVPGPELLSIQPDADGNSGRGQLWIPVESARI
ncbi:helix-turn-helix domain-containing protein [Glutamicibacter arilaitensis]|uniref:AraC family transcriptional regulator n=1 Tax=Glutamicibacter arilaitensis TaxID=256701 RepID=UPI00384E49D8